jgi:hypothetical protein
MDNAQKLSIVYLWVSSAVFPTLVAVVWNGEDTTMEIWELIVMAAGVAVSALVTLFVNRKSQVAKNTEALKKLLSQLDMDKGLTLSGRLGVGEKGRSLAERIGIEDKGLSLAGRIGVGENGHSLADRIGVDDTGLSLAGRIGVGEKGRSLADRIGIEDKGLSLATRIDGEGVNSIADKLGVSLGKDKSLTEQHKEIKELLQEEANLHKKAESAFGASTGGLNEKLNILVGLYRDWEHKAGEVNELNIKIADLERQLVGQAEIESDLRTRVDDLNNKIVELKERIMVSENETSRLRTENEALLANAPSYEESEDDDEADEEWER